MDELEHTYTGRPYVVTNTAEEASQVVLRLRAGRVPVCGGPE
ncbi:hypothetical protein ABGB12_10685 [Actinocorallia sp. B10E7]